MRKHILLIFISLCLGTKIFATANFVYHEQSLNNVGGTCGTYLTSLSPTTADNIDIEFAIDYQNFTNRARIYYTTDGTNPSGSYGIPSGTTKVITANYFCSYNNGVGMIDVVKGTIPAQPTGTLIKYIVSAWHSSGGLEIFGSGGTNISSTSATVFSLAVSATLPVTLLSFNGKKNGDQVALFWNTTHEINTSSYQIYRSNDGVNFSPIGSKPAAGNSSVEMHYTYNDLTPAKGNNYYKIKMIDRDGRYSFTNILKISFDDKEGIFIIAQGRSIRISFSNQENATYQLRAINAAGQLIRSVSVKDDGSSTHVIDLPESLSTGVYYLNLTSNKQNITKSVWIK